MSTDTVITTVKGRFIGGGLFEPRSTEEGKPPRYSAAIVLDKNQSQKIDLITKNAIAQKWGSKVPSGLMNWGVREGDDPEFEASFGKQFINPKASKPPKTIIKLNGKIADVMQDDNIIYPGCYVAVSVSAYAYEGDRQRKIKPGVTLNLRGVLFLEDGERLDDAINSDKEFEGYDSAVKVAEVDDDFDDDEDAA